MAEDTCRGLALRAGTWIGRLAACCAPPRSNRKIVNLVGAKAHPDDGAASAVGHSGCLYRRFLVALSFSVAGELSSTLPGLVLFRDPTWFYGSVLLRRAAQWRDPQGPRMAHPGRRDVPREGQSRKAVCGYIFLSKLKDI